jgi:cbb3-type cytochrome oxidase subunit 3
MNSLKLYTVSTLFMAMVFLYGFVFVFQPGVKNIIAHNGKVVHLPCNQAATDMEVVEIGKQALDLIEMGMTVYLCGKLITLEDAQEMADF